MSFNQLELFFLSLSWREIASGLIGMIIYAALPCLLKGGFWLIKYSLHKVLCFFDNRKKRKRANVIRGLVKWKNLGLDFMEDRDEKVKSKFIRQGRRIKMGCLRSQIQEVAEGLIKNQEMMFYLEDEGGQRTELKIPQQKFFNETFHRILNKAVKELKISVGELEILYKEGILYEDDIDSFVLRAKLASLFSESLIE